jgi:outer membrane immunogenic protein
VRQAAAPSNWTGGQVGGSNGGSFANNAFADPGSYICPPGIPLSSGCFETPFNFTGHSTSYTVGPFLGYRVQVGSFVVGIEGDASYKNNSNSVAQNSTTLISSFVRNDSFSGSIKQGWDSSVRARVGYLMTPWILVYGTGGVAFERVTGTLTYAGNLYSSSGNLYSSSGLLIGSTAAVGSFTETLVGATGGGGIEVQLFGPWSARIEYRYTDFGKFNKSVPVGNNCSTCASPSFGSSVELHPSFQTVRVGLGLSF